MGEVEPKDLQRETERVRRRIAELDDGGRGQAAVVLEALLRALPGVVIRFGPDLRIRFVSHLFPGLDEADVLGAQCALAGSPLTPRRQPVAPRARRGDRRRLAG